MTNNTTALARHLAAEHERLRLLVNPIVDSPWLRQIEQATRRHQEVIESVEARWRQQMEGVMAAQRAFECLIDVDAFRRLEEAVRVRVSMTDALEASVMRSQQAAIALADSLAVAHQLPAALEASMRQASDLSALLRQMLPTDDALEFAREAEVGLARLEEAEGPEEQAQVATQLLVALLAWAKKLKPSVRSAITARNVLFFLVTVALPQAQWLHEQREDSIRDERDEAWRRLDEEHQMRVESLLAEIIATLPTLVPPRGQRIFLEAWKEAPVRLAPDRGARKIATLPECGMVEQVVQEGAWFQVIFNDGDADEPAVGWVHRHHLRRVTITDGVCEDAAE